MNFQHQYRWILKSFISIQHCYVFGWICSSWSSSLLSLSPFSSLSSTGSRLRRNSDGMLAECLLHRCPLLGPLLLLVLLINRCSFSSWPTILHFLALFRGEKILLIWNFSVKHSHNLNFPVKYSHNLNFSVKYSPNFDFSDLPWRTCENDWNTPSCRSPYEHKVMITDYYWYYDE